MGAPHEALYLPRPLLQVDVAAAGCVINRHIRSRRQLGIALRSATLLLMLAPKLVQC